MNDQLMSGEVLAPLTQWQTVVLNLAAAVAVIVWRAIGVAELRPDRQAPDR
jgi:hypothetical protein